MSDSSRRADRDRPPVAGVVACAILAIALAAVSALGAARAMSVARERALARAEAIGEAGADAVLDGPRAAIRPVRSETGVRRPPAGGLDPTRLRRDANGSLLYLVARGDTLCRISAACGRSVDALAELNRIRDVDLIYADSDLVVPS